jgi:hypothetical protein
MKNSVTGGHILMSAVNFGRSRNSPDQNLVSWGGAKGPAPYFKSSFSSTFDEMFSSTFEGVTFSRPESSEGVHNRPASLGPKGHDFQMPTTFTLYG